MADIDARINLDSTDAEAAVGRVTDEVRDLGTTGESSLGGLSAGLLAVGDVADRVTDSLLAAGDAARELNEGAAEQGAQAAALGLSLAEERAVARVTGQESRDVFAIAEGVEGRLRNVSDDDRRALLDLGFDTASFTESRGVDRIQQLVDLGQSLQGRDDLRGAAGEIFGGDDARRLFELGYRVDAIEAATALGGAPEGTIRQLAGNLTRQGLVQTDEEAARAVVDSFEAALEDDLATQRRRQRSGLEQALFALPISGPLADSVETLVARQQLEVRIVNGDIRADVSEAARTDQLETRDSTVYRRPR